MDRHNIFRPVITHQTQAMANHTKQVSQNETPVTQPDYPELTRNFELIYTLAAVWLLAGSYADGWSHKHVPELEAVFTPAHIILYTGAGLLAGFVVYQVVKNYASGFELTKTLPFGYHNAIWGVLIFTIAGPSDLLWHSIFGVEQDIEATFSPTHFAAMIGIFLIYSAPLVAWLKRTEPFSKTGLVESLPAIVSATGMFSLITLVTTWSNPFAYLFPSTHTIGMSSNINQGFGMISIMFQTIILMSLILVTMKNRILPVGSYTIIMSINGLLVQVMNYNFFLIPAAVVSGIAIDYLYLKLNPSEENLRSFRLVAFMVPIIWWFVYFAAIAARISIWWSPHTWTGAIFIPGVFGLLVSYLVVPLDYIPEAER